MADNTRFLSTFMKEVYHSAPTVPRTISYQNSKDGFLIPIVDGIFLHSRYYTEKEAERYTREYKPRTTVIAIGFGAGYHLIELAKSFTILAVTEDPALTAAILKNIDLASYFKPDSLTICAPEELVSLFDVFKYDHYELVINGQLTARAPESTAAAVEIIKSKLNPYLANCNTQKTFSKKWFKNALFNLMRAGEYNETPLTISSKAILICGAGPSLDTALPTIKEHRTELYIAATDTAAQGLIKNGIKPDGIFTMDASLYTYHHFPGTEGIRIFKEYTSPLRIPTAEITLLFSDFPLLSLFPVDHTRFPRLDTGRGNIGGALLRFFGEYFPGHPLMSCGIDYGFMNHRVYSRGCYHDTYKYINGNYFVSAENIDAQIYYRNGISETKDGWSTNALYKWYGSVDKENIYSLSNSPYLHANRIKDLSDFLQQLPIISETLYFDYQTLREINIHKILLNTPKKEIEQALIPYRLALGKEDSYQEIMDAIEAIARSQRRKE